MNTMPIELAGRLLFLAVVVAAAFCDMRSRRIPNALTFPMTFAALGVNCAVSGYNGAAIWLTGLVAGTGLLLVPYLMGGIGAGDVKLLAMSGAMLGSFQVFCAFVAASVFGSLMAVAAGSSRRSTVDSIQTTEKRRRSTVDSQQVSDNGQQTTDKSSPCCKGGLLTGFPCIAGDSKAPPGIPYGLPLAAGVLLSAAGVWL